MRILVVSQYFWPEDFRINELVKDFKKRGHDIVVLTGVPNYPEGKIFSDYKRNKSDFSELNGCQIIRVPIIPRGKNKISLFLIGFIMILFSELSYKFVTYSFLIEVTSIILPLLFVFFFYSLILIKTKFKISHL